MIESQRSIVWASMSDESLVYTLGRLTARTWAAREAGDDLQIRTWRTLSEEILFELELRRDDPTSAS